MDSCGPSETNSRSLKARRPFGRGALTEPPSQPADQETFEGLDGPPVAARSLKEFICMCAWCKRVRDEEHRWSGIDGYLLAQSVVQTSHGICPDCLSDQLERH